MFLTAVCVMGAITGWRLGDKVIDAYYYIKERA